MFRWGAFLGGLLTLISGGYLLFGGAPTSAGSEIIYVDSDAPGPVHDGTSWTTAYLTLTAGLNAASAGREIWVAEGVYTPTRGVTRSVSFVLPGGVALYGGFGGYGISETLRSQRNWSLHRTILSGDLGGDDLNSDGNFIAERWDDIVGANAFHVVSSDGVTRSAVIDGFIITAGYAEIINAGNRDRGAGMFNLGSQVVLENITFTGNWSYAGGAGLCNRNSSALLRRVVFNGNYTPYYGAGMYNEQQSRVSLLEVIFFNNYGGSGGGLFNSSSSVAMTRTQFISNQAKFYGGGMFDGSTHAVLNEVLFSGNAADRGGGLYNMQDAPLLRNVTLAGNRGGSGGGGIHNNAHSAPVLVNSIVWGNLGGEIVNITGTTTTVMYSDVAGGYPGIGNFDLDPQFVMPVVASTAPTSTGDYRLRYGSPLIDAGNNVSVTTDADLVGASRISGGQVDLGAYESNYQLLTVVRSGTGANFGSVTSAPAGLACGKICTYGFASGTLVNLTALETVTPVHVTFGGWSGACSGAGPDCTLMMAAPLTVTTWFSAHYDVSLPLVVRN